MDVVVILYKTSTDCFFECKTECDRSEEPEQCIRTSLIILAYRCGRKTEAILEKLRWLFYKGRATEIVRFIGNQEPLAVKILNGFLELGCA